MIIILIYFQFPRERTILVLVNGIGLASVKTALLIKDSYGLQYTFVIPAIAMLCSAICAAIFMPETHGLTRREIAKIYAEGDKELIMVSLCRNDISTCLSF